VTAAGRTLAHLRYGAGPRPVVLLHGFLGSARNLTTLARRLAGRLPALTVVGMDLTGHGGSPPLPPGADLATLAGDVLATARSLGLGAPLWLVGHSLGGRVALRAARLEPAALADVTLLDIGPSPVPPGATDTSRVVDALVAAPAEAPSREDFRVHFRRAGLPGPLADWLLLNVAAAGGVHRWRIDRAALAGLHGRTNAEDLWAAVEGARPYALRCIRGAASPYVTAADVRRLETAGCAVVSLDRAGHFLHVDRPHALLDTLVAALAP
jgi:esterase